MIQSYFIFTALFFTTSLLANAATSTVPADGRYSIACKNGGMDGGDFRGKGTVQIEKGVVKGTIALTLEQYEDDVDSPEPELHIFKKLSITGKAETSLSPFSEFDHRAARIKLTLQSARQNNSAYFSSLEMNDNKKPNDMSDDETSTITYAGKTWGGICLIKRTVGK